MIKIPLDKPLQWFITYEDPKTGDVMSEYWDACSPALMRRAAFLNNVPNYRVKEGSVKIYGVTVQEIEVDLSDIPPFE